MFGDTYFLWSIRLKNENPINKRAFFTGERIHFSFLSHNWLCLLLVIWCLLSISHPKKILVSYGFLFWIVSHPESHILCCWEAWDWLPICWTARANCKNIKFEGKCFRLQKRKMLWKFSIFEWLLKHKIIAICFGRLQLNKSFPYRFVNRYKFSIC